MTFKPFLTTALWVGLLALNNILTARADREFTISNSCPDPIPVYINGESQGVIEPGQDINRTVADDWTGLIFTNFRAPGGISGLGTTRAGFVNQAGYYYLVKDPSNFNVGVAVLPYEDVGILQNNGFCTRLSCSSPLCANAFAESLAQFPVPIPNVPPESPLFECSTTGYNVQFCPSGTYPRVDGTGRLHPNGNAGKCMTARLDTTGGRAINGTLVQISDCDDSPSQSWSLTPGSTSVRLAGTQFCLDAGSIPEDYTPLKVWLCIENLPAQGWIYTPQSQLILQSAGLCTDLANGEIWNGNSVRTRPCTTTGRQIWTIS
ncbi:ricin B-like lectin [Coprinopsis marcescibilis]|uniref:Ricin B-like lectin n=1 Tax=Coprinopsis marcescibilis TaxID=230819 RepID=A0A5C3KSL4_COPMA|nr:ricin B-like lectin [Coprinopsis marcescibilis]